MLRASVVALGWLLMGPAAYAGTYDAKLPPGLATTGDLCALVPCADVFPGANRFSARMGQPPYVEAWGRSDTAAEILLGYVMLSTDITDTPAYSGKPVVTLIGMDVSGRYVGVKVLKHSEPILLLGIPEGALEAFNRQYVGKSVKDRIDVGPDRPDEQVLGVDAISGATVTVIAQNQVLQLSGKAVARQVGIIPPVRRNAARYQATGRRYTWQQLVDLGAIQTLRVLPEQVGLERSGEPFIELWFGDLNHPDVARSLLGERGFEQLKAHLKPAGHAIFILRSSGSASFKGSGFVRGGIFDRIQVKQGDDSFTFRDLDYLNLYDLAVPDAPAHDESGIFVLRTAAFSAAYPWRLAYLGNRVDRATGQRSFTVFDASLWLADSLLVGGRPAVAEQQPIWQPIWRRRAAELVAFSLLLLTVGIVYALRERLARRCTHKHKWPINIFKYSAWAMSISVVGFGWLAQPSITQVLTWFNALLFHWQWSLFLSDPFIFLFWIFIIVTVFLFGRGLFCGWLCPFGSLSEVLYKFGSKIGLRRWQRTLPRQWHDRLKWLKYAIFFGLLAVSLFSTVLAERLAEIEPFKTTFLVGIMHRPWPYGLFVALLLSSSLFIERPYCKYLCPLGGALAIPSTFRWFGLRRKQDCNRCKACAAGCGSLAIDTDGRIDHRECLHCLDCLVLYTDVRGCPPLAAERKFRSRHGLAETLIDQDGYFVPLPGRACTTRVIDGPDPRMPTDAVTPAHQLASSGLRAMALDLRDHLWPWTISAWQQQRILGIAGISLAIAASVAWAIAATGRLSSGAVIGWWFGWSVYEVGVRLTGKRYVKDGPWWRRHYRVATLMDMLSYVSFKNLLIGAALFLGLKFLGVALVSPAAAATLQVAAGDDLEATLRRAKAGDVVVVARGQYHGHFLIDRPLTLRGVGRPTLSGDLTGSTISVTAPDVTIEGLIVRDSGDRLKDQNAGIYIHPGAHRARVHSCDLTYNLFGLWIEKADDVRIENNLITGKRDYHSAQRGNGVQLYNTERALVAGNRISFVRDALYIDVSHHAVFRNNQLHHSRYGTHYMNSYHNLWEGNDSYLNRGGLALMEVRDQVVRNNRAWSNTDHGIMLRTLQDSVIENNVSANNGRGLFIYDVEYATLRHNLVLGNPIGVHLSAGSTHNIVEGNDFIGNQQAVRYVGAHNEHWGVAAGNYWSNYLGWDRNGDGRGDIPFAANDAVDRMLWKYPSVKLLLASPALQALRLAARQFPLLQVPTVTEEHPRMAPQNPHWREWRDRIHGH